MKGNLRSELKILFNISKEERDGEALRLFEQGSRTLLRIDKVTDSMNFAWIHEPTWLVTVNRVL